MKLPFKTVLLDDILEYYPEIDPQTSSEAELEVLLYKLGIDINFGFEQLTRLFRDSKDKTKVENKVCWSGIERSDKVWRDSGNASEECLELFRSSIARDVGDKLSV
jgi:hypothetical protein